MFEKLKNLIANYENELIEVSATNIDALVEDEIERIKPSIREKFKAKVESDVLLLETKISAINEAYEVILHSYVESDTVEIVEDNTFNG